MAKRLRNANVRQFALTAFSAILPNTTGRKGKQHGFFADNTPLSAGQEAPPYEDAVAHFTARIVRNLSILERLYASLERDGRQPADELARAKVVQADTRTAKPGDYGIKSNSIAGIITSPPYLCMADYTLGNRLSYEWLFQDRLSVDFSAEIGARRRRGRPALAAEKYFDDMGEFARNAQSLLRQHGYLAIVVGEPLAKAFRGMRVFDRIDKLLIKQNFSPLWSIDRTIQWHRNHGYERLRTERIAVYRFNI
jgi:hypothetical protein